MMNLNSRLESFVSLGNTIRDFLNQNFKEENPLFSILEESIEKAGKINAWFTRESVEHALHVWSLNLKKENLEKWLEPYIYQINNAGFVRNVAVIMAGNIPLVGFHDFLAVLFSGNQFIGRPSSNDTELIQSLTRILISLNGEWEDKISFTKEKLTGFDAVIATGSNNSAHYFNYYFSRFPHIIRKNRNGVAILTGNEDEKELSGLADDIFLYYGLGCRNVSKLFIPKGYNFDPLFKSFHRYLHFSVHNKWMNNHDYYCSVYQLNQISAYDNGFVILTENNAIASPPAVIYFEYYLKMEDLVTRMTLQEDEIQVIICKKEIPFSSVLPGFAQIPGLSDYPDGIDTMKFLLDIRK